MPWDDNFKYECSKLYNTVVIPKVNEINALSSETSVLKNFGAKVFADEDERRKLGYVGVGLTTTTKHVKSFKHTFRLLFNLIDILNPGRPTVLSSRISF